MSRTFTHTGRTDANHAEIVSALRRCGCSVLSLASIGKGCPDLLVGIGDRNILLEIKSDDGKLTSMQQTWLLAWNGPVRVVRNVDDALAAIGLLKQPTHNHSTDYVPLQNNPLSRR